MSFIGFLYKGERPTSDAEDQLKADNQRLAQEVLTLETRLARLRSSGPPVEIPPPATLPTGMAWTDTPSEAGGRGPTTGAPPAGSPAAARETLPTIPEKAAGQLKIAVFVAYAMTGLAALDLVGIIVLLAIGRDVPDFMQLTLSAIVGYFGGALHAYMGVQAG